MVLVAFLRRSPNKPPALPEAILLSTLTAPEILVCNKTGTGMKLPHRHYRSSTAHCGFIKQTDLLFPMAGN